MSCLTCGNDTGNFKYKGYCSWKCRDEHKKWLYPANTECTFCGKMFWVKPSHKNNSSGLLGFCCSRKCASENKKTKYLGSSNPNFRDVKKCCAGYLISDPSPDQKRIKIHKKVCLDVLGVDNIDGKKYHIHHRDCNKENNDPSNLAILTASDHKWLHKNYGIYPLAAMMHGKISMNDLVSWSRSPEKARRILSTCVLTQTAKDIGVVKGGELLGSPEEGNQQPSTSSNAGEGPETRDRDLSGQ